MYISDPLSLIYLTALSFYGVYFVSGTVKTYGLAEARPRAREIRIARSLDAGSKPHRGTRAEIHTREIVPRGDGERGTIYSSGTVRYAT